MKKVSIEVYEHSELSSDAFKKALGAWNKYNDMPFLQSMLNDECGQLLKKHGIICTSNHPVCLYSLSHSQGDGLMFEGSFKWVGYSIKVKHKGHYYHSHCKDMDIDDSSGATLDYEKAFREFNDIYSSICKTLENIGYALIEDETSEAHFRDICNENEWMFTKDRTLFTN